MREPGCFTMAWTANLQCFPPVVEPNFRRVTAAGRVKRQEPCHHVSIDEQCEDPFSPMDERTFAPLSLRICPSPKCSLVECQDQRANIGVQQPAARNALILDPRPHLAIWGHYRYPHTVDNEAGTPSEKALQNLPCSVRSPTAAPIKEVLTLAPMCGSQ